MKSQNVVREGAISLGIYIGILLISLIVPLVGLVSFLFLPFPFIYFSYKYELRAGIVLGLVSFLILVIVFGPLAVPLTLLFSVTGIVIGELFRRKEGGFPVLLGGSLSFIASIVFIYIGTVVFFNLNPIDELQQAMYEQTEIMSDMLFIGGQSEEEALTETVHDIIEEIGVIAPFLMIIIGVGWALIIQLIAYGLLRKKGYPVTGFPPIREWGFPKSFIWYYLITYLFIIIGVSEGTAMYTAIANLMPMLELIMVIQGFAFIFFYAYIKRINRVLPIFLVILGVVFPIFLHIVRILGIIDLGFDLRKRINPQN
ncbi:YybS family protein [Bacillus sp. A301a_S52]|nr:YybS family protein [Bacillus sp. A301a_S52]